MGGDAASPSDAALIAAILSAFDHYTAIGVGRDVDSPTLRRSYLKAMTLVHPDKNKHPDATEAFQRLRLAWHVLSDAGRRFAYDQQLSVQDGGAGVDEAADQDAFSASSGDEPDAYTAVGSAANMDAPNEMQQERAHRLAQGQDCAQGSRAGHSVWGLPPATLLLAPSPARDAALGVALSLGGYVAGAGLDSAGFTSSGHMVQQCALLQLAGQVTSALQVEEVREGLAECAGRAHEVAGNMSRRASSYAEWMSCPPLPCLPGTPDTDTDSDAEAELSHTREQWPWRGAWVRLRGLRQASHLNGRVGEVVAADGGTGRVVVRLFLPLAPLHAAPDGAAQEDSAKRVKVENLEPAAERTAWPPRELLQFI